MPSCLTVSHGAAQDAKCARHIKTYEVSLQDKDFGPGSLSFNNVDAGASILIPVPGVRGGVIVVGEQSIAFTNGASPAAAL
jgi:DNA damage-binding protein 1